MKIHQLINWLDDSGDAVSDDCMALARYLRELGYHSEIFVRHLHSNLRHLARPAGELQGDKDDIVLMHFCGATDTLPEYVAFPGRRMMKYHGITPPEFFRGIPEMKELAQFCYEGFAQLRRVASITELAIGDSNFDAKELAEHGYSRTSVVPIAMELQELVNAPFDENLVCKYRQPDFVNLLFVGRLAPNKRADHLLELLKAYKRSCTNNVRLLLVGKTVEQYTGFVNSLRRHAALLGLEEGTDLILPGKVTREGLCSYYRAASAFVSMSEHEGFGVPMVEAMAFGVPTFGFASAAVPETIGTGGELFEQKNFPELARRIHSIITDSRRREKLIQRQYDRIREFDPEATKAKLARLLSSLERNSFPGAVAFATPANTGVPISVVISTCNRAAYLRRALKALQSQTYRNFEVIVVSGPSTDDTETVLHNFCRARKINIQDRNLAVSRNTGIRAARGDIIAFLDDGAIPGQGWLAGFSRYLQDWHLGAVGGAVFSADGKRTQFMNGTVNLNGIVVPIRQNPPGFNDPSGTEFNMVMGTNSAFRRAALYDIGLFDEEFSYSHDETDVCVRLIRSGWKILHCPDVTVLRDFALGPFQPTTRAYDLNWYEIIRNTVYFGIKHRPAGVSLGRQLLAVTRNIYRERLTTFRRWARNGEIDGKLYRRILRDSVRGFRQGYRRALKHKPAFDETMPSGMVQPYLEDREAPLSVCILAQDLPWSRWSNVAEYAWRLARGVSAMGHNVHVVTKASSEYEELRDGVHIHAIPPAADDIGLPGQPACERTLRYSLSVARQVKGLHEVHHFDIVESPLSEVEGLAFALRSPTRLIVSVQKPLACTIAAVDQLSSDNFALWIDLEKELLRKADGIVSPSRYVLDEIRKFHGLSCEIPAEIIPIGVEPMEEVPLRWSGNHLPSGVLFVGRLDRKHGIQELFEAIPRVITDVPSVRFSIVGQDELPWGVATEEYFRSSVPASVAHCVSFHGKLDDAELQKMYESCDVLVAPWLCKSSGTVLLQAMRRGKPVIVTKVGAAPEIVADGVTGLVVPNANPDKLASAITGLLRDEDMRRRLGKAAFEAIGSYLNEERMCRERIRFYRRVAGQSARAAEESLCAEQAGDRPS